MQRALTTKHGGFVTVGTLTALQPSDIWQHSDKLSAYWRPTAPGENVTGTEYDRIGRTLASGALSSDPLFTSFFRLVNWRAFSVYWNAIGQVF